MVIVRFAKQALLDVFSRDEEHVRVALREVAGSTSSIHAGLELARDEAAAIFGDQPTAEKAV